MGTKIQRRRVSDVTIPALPEKVGADPGRVGRELSAAFRQQNELALDALRTQARKKNNLDAINARAQFRSDLRGKRLDISENKKGANATVELQTQSQEAAEALRDSYLSNMSEGAQLIFRGMAESDMNSHLNSVARHIAQQQGIYQKQTEEAMLTSAINKVQDQPDAFDVEWTRVQADMESMHEGEDITATMDEYYNSMRAAQIESMIDSDFEAADLWLEENKDQIDLSMYKKAKRVINHQRQAVETANRLAEAEAKKQKEAEWHAYRGNVYRAVESDDVTPAELMEIRRAVLRSDLPVQGEHGADWLINKIDAKAKQLQEGGANVFKEYDPGTEAQIREWVNINPREIEKRGGEGYIWGMVGRGRHGGLTSKQAEAFVNKLRKPEEKNPRLRGAYNMLKVGMKNDIFKRTEDEEEGRTEEEVFENLTTYNDILTQLDERVAQGEDPIKAANELLNPYIEQAVDENYGLVFRSLFGGGRALVKETIGLFSDEESELPVEEPPAPKSFTGEIERPVKRQEPEAKAGTKPKLLKYNPQTGRLE